MINKVKEAVATKLYSLYPDFTNYVEVVPQNFKTPSFFINPLEVTIKKMIAKNRYYRSNPFVIQCFLEDRDSERNTKLCDIAENLLYELETILVDESPIRGTKINFNFVDGVLNFFVSFNFYVVRVYGNENDVDYMEELDLSIKVVD